MTLETKTPDQLETMITESKATETAAKAALYRDDQICYTVASLPMCGRIAL